MENAIVERLMEIALLSALVFCAVALFRLALRRWLSPQVRYLLWFLVVLRLLVPVTWESGFHLFTLPELPVQAAVPESPTLAPTVPEERTASPEGDAPLSAGGTVMPAALPDAPAATQAQRKSLSLSQWLLFAWGAGATLVLLVHAVMAIRLRRRLCTLGRSPDADTKRLYARAREALGIHGRLPVLLLPDIASPALTAGIRPKLLLPDGRIGGGTREEQAFSLLHELMHYKRGDHLVCLLLTLLRVIWWWNPVAWALPRCMRIDMESACDAQVVKKMDKRQKLSYAGLLLELGQEECDHSP